MSLPRASTTVSRVVRRALERPELAFETVALKSLTTIGLPLTNRAFGSEGQPLPPQRSLRERRRVLSEIGQILCGFRDLGQMVEIGDKRVSIGREPLRQTWESAGFSLTELRNALGLSLLGAKWGFQIGFPDQEWPGQRFMLSNHQITTEDGVRFWLETIDPWVLVETFVLGTHDVPALDGADVLDVGAAFGDSCLRLASAGARILAVEPINMGPLRANLDLNPELKVRIVPVEVAVGPRGECGIQVRDGSIVDGNATGFLSHPGRRRVVKSATISEILDAYNTHVVDYLKMDCKGCERTISQSDLGRVRRVARIDYSFARDQSFRGFVSLLMSSGFRVRTYHYNPETNVPLERTGTLIGVR